MTWRERLIFYPTLGYEIAASRVRSDRPWSTQLDDTVILGALPFARDMRRHAAAGVKYVVNLCGEFDGLRHLYRELNLCELRLPVSDFQSPTCEQLGRGISVLEDCAASKVKAYVHCKAGRGRSGTLALCWLAKSQNLTLGEAMKRLTSLRPHVTRGLDFRPPAIECFQSW